MNFFQYLVHVGHVLGILSGNDPTVTTIGPLSTAGLNNTNLTTPVILDTTIFDQEINKTVSPKFLSTTFGSTEQEKDHTTMVSGITQETAPEEANTTISTGGTGSDTTVYTDSSTDTNVTDSNTTITNVPTGNGTTITESNTPGNETTVTEPATTVTEPVTGNGTTVTEPVTGNGTTVTEPVTGSGTTVTGSDPSTHPTDVPPTPKPGLSRGAVAGIVIGCLLLIAVIAAAVVFFLKNRNAPPEAQRLRV